MLGKNAKRPVHGLTNDGPTTKAVASNVNAPTNPIPGTRDREVESDEEYGRSTLGKSKRYNVMQTAVIEGKGNENGEGEQGTSPEGPEPFANASGGGEQKTGELP